MIEVSTCAIGFLGLLLFAMMSVGAAYRNGCNDGYGYSREPDNPGYQKAGKYLKKYCADRWPELRD